MFDREQFKEAIKVQLQDIPEDKRVAFAVRSAIRVLPLLANPQDLPFTYWHPIDASKYLLVILEANSCSIEYALTKEKKYIVNTNAAARAANSYTASYVANAATYANASNAAYVAAYAAAYAVEAAYISGNAHTMIQEIQLDLAMLNEITAEKLLQQPLWSEAISENWQQLLVSFKVDVLSLNAGFDVWLDWYDDRLQGKPLDVELLQQWNNIPKEIEAQGAVAVNAYLKNLLQKNLTHPLNRVRAIFIGYGEAGKTSLIRALHNEEVIKGTEAMTAGIDIRDWDVPNSDIKAHFWDFGGQVVFHSTHKFFLRSSCVYIIVINARADINNSEQAEYWLDHIKVFGGSAPVLLVGNKADEAEVHLQMESLKQKYPNIRGFYPVSCTQAKTNYSPQFASFENALTHELTAVGIHQMRFTAAQAKVLDELRQYSPDHAFLSEDDFNQLCDKYSISNEGELNRAWLVDIFDKLGVMLHFDELKTFNNAYMLNPRWLTHGVYTLMNAKQARLNDGDIVRILKASKVEDEHKQLLSYDSIQCVFISKAMQRFKLYYPLPNGTNALMIPALLNDELPNYPAELKNSDTLQFEFAFMGFLPRNLIGEFMVSRYEEIKANCQSQRGAVFASKSLQAQALVEADYHRRLLVMQVYGRDAKEYLTILYDAMLTVFGELNLDYREWVVLPMSACLDKETLGFNRKVEKAPYQQLLAYAKNKESKYISESGLKYDLNKVLGIIMSDAEQAKQGITNNFYNSSPNLTQTSEIDMSETTRTITTSVYVEGDVNGGNIAGRNVIIKTGKDADVKPLLEQLLAEIKALNGKIPAQNLADMTEGVEKLINEGNRETPRKKWYEASLEGIKEAALAVGDIAKPVLDIAEKLSPLLLGL
jgi:GTPase SAR1 family protein